MTHDVTAKLVRTIMTTTIGAITTMTITTSLAYAGPNYHPYSLLSNLPRPFLLAEHDCLQVCKWDTTKTPVDFGWTSVGCQQESLATQPLYATGKNMAWDTIMPEVLRPKMGISDPGAWESCRGSQTPFGKLRINP